MKFGKIDPENRSVINDCDSCGGHHEVILKNCNDRLKAKGFTHWFECPQHAQGGPVMVQVPVEEIPVVSVEEKIDESA